jgi:DNA-binding response OmpR family regulator
MQRVLIVDDDVELCDLLGEFLRRDGLESTAVHTGEEGVVQALKGDYDVVVLDVMLPSIGGFEVLRRIRAADGEVSQLPVLMLTARGDEVDRVLGLELGADDYLPKPFSSRELVARLRAILRRSAIREAGRGDEDSEILQVGDIELDSQAREARRNGEPLELTSVEFNLLEMLMRGAGDVVTRDVIAQEVLGRVLLPYDRSLDTHVSNLRRKLGPDQNGRERIKTVRSTGYIYARPAQSTLQG